MSQTTFVIVWLAVMAVIMNITLAVRQENVLGKKKIEQIGCLQYAHLHLFLFKHLSEVT